MVKKYRFIALLGHGRENFSDKELDAEWPTEPVVIDAFGFSDVYRYSGVVFLSEEWFAKYDKNWKLDTAVIDKLLIDLIKYSVDDEASENLKKIKSYLSSPPESLEETVALWRSFYDPELKRI